LNRSFVSALLSLVCVASSPAIAQTPGPGEVQVTLSPAANPTGIGVLLTGTVQPVIQDATMRPPHPAGTVTFFDGSTALGSGGVPVIAGAGSNAATFEQTFGMSDAVRAYPGTSWQCVTGDFNGDGTPDLLIFGVGNGTLLWQVFASVPGGKFVVLPFQNFPFTNIAFPGISVLDLDGDGHLDLLIGNLVVRGKGDGTFFNNDATILPVLAGGFIQAYAADINGDGKLDIVAVNAPPLPNVGTGTIQYAFTVFRNDGAGTFTSLGSFPLAASFDGGTDLCCSAFNIFGLSFADLNGDGKTDVLSQSNRVPLGNSAQPNQLNVMLNNGDGTFGPAKAVDTSSTLSLGYDATESADLNDDGKLDLVLGYSRDSGGNYVAAALGNGDGTFGTIQQLLLGASLARGIPPFVELIDFNLDGKVDAVLGSGELALGNGDGTLSLSMPLFPQPSKLAIDTPIYYPLIQATLFPNSLPSLIYLNLTGSLNLTVSGDAVFTPADSSSATMAAVLNAGSHSLTAHYSGDSTFAATASPAVTIDVAPWATKTTVTSSTNPSYAGEDVTFVATISGLFNPLAGSTDTVTFSDGTTVLGMAPVSGGSATLTTSFSSPGNHTITAAYSGDPNSAVSSGSLSQAVEAPVTVGGSGGDATSLTVASGQSVTTTVSVTGAAGFGGTVNFSCTGLPMNAACSFAPASVAVSGTAAAATTLTVSTAATTMAAVREGESSRALTVLACGLPMLGLLTLLPVARGRRLLLCLGFALLVSMTSLTGCGGNSSGETKTAAGTYAFNVVATSGSATSTASYKLTVQ
jgi:hypothetical protein